MAYDVERTVVGLSRTYSEIKSWTMFAERGDGNGLSWIGTSSQAAVIDDPEVDVEFKSLDVSSVSEYYHSVPAAMLTYKDGFVVYYVPNANYIALSLWG